MDKLLKTATTSPGNLWLNPKFWISERQFLVRLMAAFLLILVVFIFTYPRTAVLLDRFVAWGAMLFHCLTVWGIIYVLKVMARIKVEHAIADYVDLKATEELRKIKNGEKDRIYLDRIDSEILPDNEDESLGMIRIFRQVLKEARDRNFDSSVNVMETYREESAGDIFKLQSTQRIALQLGILGTFIGLMLALEKLTLGTPEEIINQLSSALKISFGTSVAGLEVSVTLWLFIMLLRKKQDAYFKSMENATITMISLARNAINTDEFIAEISQIKRYIEDLGNRIHDQSQRFQSQTIEVQAGMEKLAQAKMHFDEFLKEISQSQVKFVDEIKTVYDIFSPTRISGELKTTLDGAVDTISGTFRDKMGRASEELTDLNAALESLKATLSNLEEQVLEQSRLIKEGDAKVNATKSEFYTTAKKMEDSQLKFIGDVNAVLEKMDLEKLNRELETFNDMVRKMNRKQHLTKINTELKSEIAKFFSRMFKSSKSKHNKSK
jgi:biopolymer transport protein ExbB/TolQ